MNLFRVRLFIYLTFGYDPLLVNADQSPFHHNETGSQNKPTLAVRGSTVPVVEGNNDCKARWTANLETRSRFDRSRGDQMPAAECMFKAESEARVVQQLRAWLRSRGAPAWLTVTAGPKGSYREHDVIAFLERHLEPWTEGRDWRIYLLDDFRAHKTKNVRNFCWSRGYVLVVHGGGTTPYGQTCDTDLNEFVRFSYGEKESRLLLEKMRCGQVVPRVSPEECLQLLWDVWKRPELHEHAAAGYKKVGQSIDLHGSEDQEVCREAGTFWNEETTDGYACMRLKINTELAVVAEEFDSDGLPWCFETIQRLLTAYPEHRKIDKVLNNVGEDHGHDSVHMLHDDEALGGADSSESSEVADADEGMSDAASDGGDPDAKKAERVHVAVASEGAACNDAADAEQDSLMVSTALSAEEADELYKSKATQVALQGHIDGLRCIGEVRIVQVLEERLAKEKRKQRAFVKASPAVAESFQRLRRAEEEEKALQLQLADQQRARKRDAAKAIADKDAAVAELRNANKQLKALENLSACRYAIKTFTPQALGQGARNAGGLKARKNRWDVMDRLARLGAGLSPGQRNDWAWFKDAWDAAMVEKHGPDWGNVFATKMQGVLEDDDSNAFSVFVYNETCSVFKGVMALHVPGG